MASGMGRAAGARTGTVPEDARPVDRKALCRPRCGGLRGSGEGRVGEECRSPGAPYHLKKKKKTFKASPGSKSKRFNTHRTAKWGKTYKQRLLQFHDIGEVTNPLT